MAWLTGYPREKVNWYPTVNLDKCVMCGMCMNCGKQVYTWTKKGPVVTNPDSCVIGCTSCQTLCKGDVISFPDISDLRAFYKKENIWSKVKEQMTKEGKLNT